MAEISILWQALLLGVLQGLTEFLPISSSAHLILFPWLFQWKNPLIDSLTFDVALHAGTLVAIVGYFWNDWKSLGRGFFRVFSNHGIRDFHDRLVLYILLASIPAAVVGLYLEEYIEKTFRNPLLICIPLVLVSLLMIFAEKGASLRYPLSRITFKDSFMIGIAQAIALFPGVSRSGITITTGIFLGYQREAATRFSFLLSAPAIGGASLLHLRHLFRFDLASDWPVFVIGFFSSALVGYLAIAFLLRYLRVHTLNVFAGYRLALAGLVLFRLYWSG